MLDGDGSLLMNLGTLVTIAEVAPRNLIHFVFENRNYEANGSHRTPAHGHVDFSGLARLPANGAPYVRCSGRSNEVGGVVGEPRPVFVTMKLSRAVAEIR